MRWRVVGRVVIDVAKDHSALTFEAQAVQGKWPALQLAILFGRTTQALCCFEMSGDVHPLTH